MHYSDVFDVVIWM